MEPPRRSPGSPSALRAANEQTVMTELVSGGATTQAELARRTGLSAATVSNIVHTLVDRGMVETSPTVASGRRATLVSPGAGSDAVAIGVDFGRAHRGIIISTIGLEVLLEERIERDTGAAPAALADASSRIESMLAELGRTRADVVGVCVGIPGPIEAATSRVTDGSILPEWVGVDEREVSHAFGMPVVLANDAYLGAMAARTWGPHTDVEDLMFVKIGTGIGAGLVMGGSVHLGAFGLTGEIGHSTVDPGGDLCRCGNRGCLETVSSTRVIARQLSGALGRPVEVGEIVSLAQSGHLGTRRIVYEASYAVGQALANAANLLNPSVIVIGGPLIDLGDDLIRPIIEGFKRFAIPVVREQTTIVASSLGDRAEVLGAVAVAVRDSDTAAFMRGTVLSRLR